MITIGAASDLQCSKRNVLIKTLWSEGSRASKTEESGVNNKKQKFPGTTGNRKRGGG